MKKTTLFMALALMGLSANIANAQTTIASGDCGASGNNLTWVLTDDSVLTISGSGDMADYIWMIAAPWGSNRNKIKTLVIGNSVTSIGDWAFYNCNELSGVLTIPNSVRTIGNYAFRECFGLTGELTIPSSVTTIGMVAFAYCGLTSLTIPNSVTTIEGSAFANCSRLTSITCNAVVPPSFGDWGAPFFSVTNSIPVYVPCLSLNAYQTSSWNYFNNIHGLSADADTNFISAAICNGTVYTTNGFNASTEGIHSLTMQNANGCDSTITLNLSVYAIVDTTFINATITEGETYVDNGFNESTAGTYQLILQNVNGCDSVIVLNLTVNTNGLNDIEATDFNIYPNPASDRLFIEGEGFERVIVYDVLGKEVLASNKKEIDISGLASGVYNVCILQSGKTVATKKVVKQ